MNKLQGLIRSRKGLIAENFQKRVKEEAESLKPSMEFAISQGDEFMIGLMKRVADIRIEEVMKAKVEEEKELIKEVGCYIAAAMEELREVEENVKKYEMKDAPMPF